MAPLPSSRTPTMRPQYDEHEDLLEGLQNISSHFELGQGEPPGTTNYLSPNPKEDSSLRDPSRFGRRLSSSTLSSAFTASTRGNSPYPPTHSPSSPTPSKTWKTPFIQFYSRNASILLVTLSQLFGALMNVTARLLEVEGPEPLEPFQILFARQGLTMVFCSLWMWWKEVEEFPLGKRDVRGLLVLRALSGFCGIYGMYSSLQYLPLADAVVITFLAPSVAGYGCYLFLKEPFSRSSQYASLISLLGVVMIARPTSLFSAGNSSNKDHPMHNTTTAVSANNTSVSTPSDTLPGYASFPTPTPRQRLDAVILALVGVFGAAGAFTSIRYIGSRAHPLISVNYFSTFCTIISFLALTLSGPLHLSSTLFFRLPSSARQWSMLLFLGVCGFIMQYLLTKGLGGNGKRRGARGMNMVYTNMLFAVGLDRWVFGIVPGWWSLAGSGCILGSAVWVAIGKEEGRDVGSGRERVDEESAGTASDEERRGMLSAADENEDEEVENSERDVELQEMQSPR